MRYLLPLILLLLACNLSRVATPPPATPNVIQFEGQGDKVITFDVSADWPVRFGFVHHSGYFSARLLNSDGSFNHVLAVNNSGDYKGETLRKLESGQYHIEIKADGGWDVIILAPQ